MTAWLVIFTAQVGLVSTRRIEWHRLLPADRELLRLIVSGVTDLFSESSRGRLGASLGLNKVVAKNVPQQALRQLQDAELALRMDYGDYRVQDDALAEWLRN